MLRPFLFRNFRKSYVNSLTRPLPARGCFEVSKSGSYGSSQELIFIIIRGLHKFAKGCCLSLGLLVDR